MFINQISLVETTIKLSTASFPFFISAQQLLFLRLLLDQPKGWRSSFVIL